MVVLRQVKFGVVVINSHSIRCCVLSTRVFTRVMYVGEIEVKDILLQVGDGRQEGRVVGPPLISVGANVRLVKMNFYKRHFTKVWKRSYLDEDQTSTEERD